MLSTIPIEYIEQYERTYGNRVFVFPSNARRDVTSQNFLLVSYSTLPFIKMIFVYEKSGNGVRSTANRYDNGR